jgi:hypothetical protein
LSNTISKKSANFEFEQPIGPTMANTDAWSSDTLVSLVVTLIEQLRKRFRTSASAMCWRLMSSPLHDTHDTFFLSDLSGNTEAEGVALSPVYPDDSTATPASDPGAREASMGSRRGIDVADVATPRGNRRGNAPARLSGSEGVRHAHGGGVMMSERLLDAQAVASLLSVPEQATYRLCASDATAATTRGRSRLGGELEHGRRPADPSAGSRTRVGGTSVTAREHKLRTRLEGVLAPGVVDAAGGPIAKLGRAEPVTGDEFDARIAEEGATS